MGIVSRAAALPDPAGLVQPDRVHRSVYADPAVFELEMERLFGRAWLFVGHESQVKAAGDYYCTRLGRQPVIMSRGQDGRVRVLHNRCTHRGPQLCTNESGNAKHFRCGYHGWTFAPDGALISVPRREGYGAEFEREAAELGLKPVARQDSYRGFVFASLDPAAPPLAEWLGFVRTSFDDMIDRAPDGEIEVAGGIFKHYYDGNWKLYQENINDILHPRYVHESSVDSASRQSREAATDGAGEIAVRQMIQNGVITQVWDHMGTWSFPYGHSFMADYHDDTRLLNNDRKDPVLDEYLARLKARLGSERMRQVLSVARFNTIVYPNLSFMSSFRQLRVMHPIAPDRTEVHVFSFRLKGAPERLFHDTVAFANAINSPASQILTDDLEMYRRIAQGLLNEGPEWLHIGRGAGRDRLDANGGRIGDHGTAETHIRNQFDAWLGYMTRAR
jgi:phenylpropionate dioxygenase-like ring-hydroxylating dioxygenase large terminal subunit